MSLRILLADDSMTAQNMGKKILTDGGYDVVTVSNGAAAMKKLAEFTPDVIIADVYMPGYNGLEICEKVKKAAATASVPVLLSVGKLEPFRPEEGLKVHADGIIIKPFEATDLLAVTAKLAERAGKAIAPDTAPAATSEMPATTVEPSPVPLVEAEAAMPEPVSAAEPIAEMPAFAMDEPAAAQVAPAYTFEAAHVDETAAPAAFALEDHQPDYVREFGLDPHDAPTTGFSFSHDYAAAIPEPAPFTVTEPQFVAQLPDFEEPAAHEVAADAAVALAPASLNLAVNAVEFTAPAPEAEGAPEIEEEQVAPVSASIASASPRTAAAPEDDFEAKLAAAMAAYDAPETEVAPTPVTVTDTQDAASALDAAAAYASETASPTWVAEEAPLTETDMAVSLEDELRAFSAVASASAPASSPALSAPPVGPIGETSFDDEVATMVEQSKDSFFPSVTSAATTEDVPSFTEPQDEPVAVTALVEDVKNTAGLGRVDLPSGCAADVLLECDSVGLANAEELPTKPEAQLCGAPASGASESFDAAPLDSAPGNNAEIPELVTHDIPTEWDAPSSDTIAQLAAGPGRPEDAAFEVPVASTSAADTAEHLLLTDDDFVSHEAPFAHAAVDEVVADVTVGTDFVPEDGTPGNAATQTAATANVMAQVVHEVVSTPSLDEAAIAQVVEGVMQRMKDDIVAQIAKELAAKLGK